MQLPQVSSFQLECNKYNITWNNCPLYTCRDVVFGLHASIYACLLKLNTSSGDVILTPILIEVHSKSKMHIKVYVLV